MLPNHAPMVIAEQFCTLKPCSPPPTWPGRAPFPTVSLRVRWPQSRERRAPVSAGFVELRPSWPRDRLGIPRCGRGTNVPLWILGRAPLARTRGDAGAALASPAISRRTALDEALVSIAAVQTVGAACAAYAAAASIPSLPTRVRRPTCSRLHNSSPCRAAHRYSGTMHPPLADTRTACAECARDPRPCAAMLGLGALRTSPPAEALSRAPVSMRGSSRLDVRS